MSFFFQELVNGITTGALYSLVALGFSMVYGVLKLLNFAHGDLYMVGAYIGFFIIQFFGGAAHVDIPVPLLLAIMFVVAAGLVGGLGVAVRLPAAAGRAADRAADHRDRRLVLPGERGPAAVRLPVPGVQHRGVHLAVQRHPDRLGHHRQRADPGPGTRSPADDRPAVGGQPDQVGQADARGSGRP
jgi:Branched-chain amino acid transport system / permease component